MAPTFMILKLVTLVVIDEYGEGITVEWMIANRENTIILKQFFEAIKQRTGNISAQWFMSDNSDNYFNAWQAVFGRNETKKIICAWHIDKTWRKALLEIVKGRDEQITIYHQLNLLLNEREVPKFQVTLQEFLTYLSNNQPKFFSYFNSNYCS